MPAQTHPLEPEELMAYLDGELSPERAARAATHLEECRECQSLSTTFHTVSARMAEWRVEAPEFALPAKPVVERRWLKPLGWSVTAAAAGLMLFSLAMKRTQTRTMSSAALPLAERKMLAPRGVFDYSHADNLPPLIAHSASLVIVVDNLDQARAAIDRILQRHNGYIAHLNVTAPRDSARNLDASLRTPTGELDATIYELRLLGKVGSESRTGEEVTQQSIDLDARLANARNTEQRLTELLRQRTGKLSDVLAVENQIDSTREEIERLEAERKNLDKRLTFATIDVHISEVYKAAIDGARAPVLTRLGNAGIEGLERVADSFIAACTWLLSAGPFLLVWFAVLFFPARWAWRRFKR
jgi:hypothetical protein